MKQKKYLAGALALSIMMMGSGYAAWTQNFTVSTMVETGKLHLGIETIKVQKVEAQVGSSISYMDQSYATANSQFEKGAEGVTLMLDAAYPGVRAIYEVEVLNDGTLPIKMNASDFKFKGLNEISRELDNRDKINITYSGEALENVIMPGETKKMVVKLQVESNMENTVTYFDDETKKQHDNDSTENLTGLKYEINFNFEQNIGK